MGQVASASYVEVQAKDGVDGDEMISEKSMNGRHDSDGSEKQLQEVVDTSPADSRGDKPYLHVVWDLDTVNINVPPTVITPILQQFHTSLLSYGKIDTITAIGNTQTLLPVIELALQSNGIELLTTISPTDTQLQLLTKLLSLSLSTYTKQHQWSGRKPMLMIISNSMSYSQALHVIRRTEIYDELMLVHSLGSEQTLPTTAPTKIVHWRDLVGEVYEEMQVNDARSQSVEPSPTPSTGERYYQGPAGVSQQPLLPTSAIYSQRPSPLLNLPSQQSYNSLRRLTPSPQPRYIPATALELPTTAHRTSDFLQCFMRVIQYCEREKIIPRESVLRKSFNVTCAMLPSEFCD